jgi:hypothetical protein
MPEYTQQGVVLPIQTIAVFLQRPFYEHPLAGIKLLVMTIETKLAFLKQDLLPLLRSLQPAQKALWGKMDAQQMVEHLRDALKVANGKIALPLVTTDTERLEKMRAFIMTDIPFKENTRSAVMPEAPRPHKYASLAAAVDKLAPELLDLFSVYEAAPGKVVMNPVFGELNYEQQISLLYKHAVHHLKQFGVME